MGTADIGISTDDFTNNALSDFGEAVTWEDCTKTKHPVSGQETLSYAGGVSKTVVFIKNTQRYQQSKEGLVDLGDAKVLAPTTLGFAKNDYITYNSEKFIIDRVIRRRPGGVLMFDTCFLIKVED